MQIRAKMLASTAISLMCLASVGFLGLFYINDVAKVSHRLVDDEAEPVVQINELEKMAWEIWSRLIVHTSTSDSDKMEALSAEISELEPEMEAQLARITQIYSQALPEEISRFSIQWASFQKTYKEALDLSREFAKEAALQSLTGTGRQLFDQALADLRDLALRHRTAMNRLRDKARDTRIQAGWVVVAITVMLGGSLLVFLLWLAFNISRPLQAALKTANSIAKGDLNARANHRISGDETGVLLLAINEMAANLQAVIRETSRVLDLLSQGTMDVRVEGEFAGDFKEIKKALTNTARQLSAATAENTRQNWLKTGQNRLSETMSGEQTLTQLAENVLNFLTSYLEANIGVVYLAEQEQNREPQLRIIASHAYVWRHSLQHRFSLGEGLVGQAALEGKIFVITRVPENYIAVRSGLGESPPKEILLAPFFYEDQLKGVVELASFGSFTELHVDFLKQVMPLVAVTVNTADSRAKMQALLEQTRAPGHGHQD